MTGRGGKGRGKKALETTLGTAASAREKVDLSQVQKPINTSVFGLKQVLSLFQTATDEVQNYIAYECDVLYECRTCRSIFRSLANFILHKRSYCKEKFHKLSPGNVPNNCHEGGFVVDSAELAESSESSRPMTPETSAKAKKILSPIIDRLRKYQDIAEFAKETLNEDLTLAKPKSEEQKDATRNDLILEKIATNSCAVFQTSSSYKEKGEKEGLMKAEVMEIHDIFENNEAVLDSEGKVRNFDKPTTIFPTQDLVCTECDFKFATIKTLTQHIKNKHNRTCTIFPCPDCKETFVNAWCVYRHLYKVHRRSLAQVKRLRNQIHSGAIRKDQEAAAAVSKRTTRVDDLVDSENQWMANFEGDKDLQMCGGCGKKFERKAALQSHSALCSKRMAICNNIKEVSKLTKDKNPVKNVKGAAKRKRVVLKIQQKDDFPNSLNRNIVRNIMGGSIHLDPKDSNDSDTSAASSINKTPPKRKPMPERKPPQKIETFDISDESSESDVEVPESVRNLTEFERILSKNCSEVKVNTVKRKRTQSCDFQSDGKVAKISSKSCNVFSDETHESFIAKASPYMKKNELKCISCQTSYPSLFLLLWHMSEHFSWYRFQCTKCSFLSFNKHDCMSHASNIHNVPQDLVEGTVVPIPKWKIITIAHKFKRLQKRSPSASVSAGKQQFDHIINNLKVDIEEKPLPVKSAVEVETIVLDEDDTDSSEDGKDVSSPPNTDGIILLDDEDNNKEENFNKRVVNKPVPGPSQLLTRANSRRPVRVRTKSVRTFHSDFIYDLENVMKSNENSVRNRLGPPKDPYKNSNRKRSSEI